MDSQLKKFIRIYKAEVAERLQDKTSWGRVELKQMLEEALSESLLELSVENPDG